jgi:cysteine desulfurase
MQTEMYEESKRIQSLTTILREGIMSEVSFMTLNGHPTKRIPGNLNLSFAFVEGEALMGLIPHIAVSSGSACTSSSLEPSYVLKALNIQEDLIHTSLRFGVGRFTTKEEIQKAIHDIVKAVKQLREMSPLYEMALEGIDIQSITWKEH